MVFCVYETRRLEATNESQRCIINSDDFVAMSGLEILAVVSCVAAVCSAYHDGTELIHQIKERRKAKKALREAVGPDSTTKDLELSLARGQDVVRSQYERDFRRLGEAFAVGDRKHSELELFSAFLSIR